MIIRCIFGIVSSCPVYKFDQLQKSVIKVNIDGLLQKIEKVVKSEYIYPGASYYNESTKENNKQILLTRLHQ